MTDPTDSPPPGTPKPAAGITPVDVDGVRAVAVGTGLWAVALIALVPFRSTLQEDGHGWWIGTCAVGVALGLVGLAFVIHRRK